LRQSVTCCAAQVFNRKGFGCSGHSDSGSDGSVGFWLDVSSFDDSSPTLVVAL
jgi:hypothetical protein